MSSQHISAISHIASFPDIIKPGFSLSQSGSPQEVTTMSVNAATSALSCHSLEVGVKQTCVFCVCVCARALLGLACWQLLQIPGYSAGIVARHSGRRFTEGYYYLWT